jgi:ribosomal protein S18 acetylase RimI-like enzyme
MLSLKSFKKEDAAAQNRAASSLVIRPQNIIVRDLKTSDLGAVARVHIEGFPGSAITLLGQEAVRRYYDWQLVGPHQATALGALMDGEVVGFCFGGVFRGATSGFLRKNHRFLTWRVLTHPWLVTKPLFRERLFAGVRLVRKSFKRKSSVPKLKISAASSFGILAIAVSPQCQGLGVGKLLMRESEQAALRLGFRTMNLTVHPDNAQAVRFYESLEWEKLTHEGVWKGSMRKPLRN